MPNPPSVYCTQNGNKLEIRTAADGANLAYVFFPMAAAVTSGLISAGSALPAAQPSPTPAIAVEANATASAKSTQENAFGGYMPPGTAEEFSDWWGSSAQTRRAVR